MDHTAIDQRVQIRRATHADAMALSVLATAIFVRTYASQGVSPSIAREVNAELSATVFGDRLDDPAAITWVIERDGAMLGFLELKLSVNGLFAAGTAEIARLYVWPTRCGWGRKLLDHADTCARALGFIALGLTAWAYNQNALDFYAHVGFQDIGEAIYRFENDEHPNRVLVRPIGR
jgi:diamine N-acetyltransferase